MDLPFGRLVTGCFLAEEPFGISDRRLEGHSGRDLPEDTMGLGPLSRGYPLSRDPRPAHGGPRVPRPHGGSSEVLAKIQPCEMGRGSHHPHPTPPAGCWAAMKGECLGLGNGLLLSQKIIVGVGRDL